MTQAHINYKDTDREKLLILVATVCSIVEDLVYGKTMGGSTSPPATRLCLKNYRATMAFLKSISLHMFVSQMRDASIDVADIGFSGTQTSRARCQDKIRPGECQSWNCLLGSATLMANVRNGNSTALISARYPTVRSQDYMPGRIGRC